MRFLLILPFFICNPVFSASFTSYVTGDTADVETACLPGTVLMGGATENDNAMRWFLQRASGGDVVVLRASGDDGYNDYFFSELGVEINSVETIVFNNASASADPYVIAQIRNAEAIWIAGGDQWDYVSYWKDTEIENAINYLINEKMVTVGGTSAGCAIQGDAYFSAENGTVTSAEALADPYDAKMTIGYDDFIQNPVLQHVITDTHFDNPDRKGRLITFLARLANDESIRTMGIACDEYTAVCIDENNIAHLYGEYPGYDDFIYFAQINCSGSEIPDVCEPGQPLDWIQNDAVKVAVFGATNDGAATFDLNDWKTATMISTWENWWVESGEFFSVSEALPADCVLDMSVENNSNTAISVFPNPATDKIQISGIENSGTIYFEITDFHGRQFIKKEVLQNTTIDISSLPPSVYILTLLNGKSLTQKKVVKI